ncbi:uncharacterized protein AB9W97_010292 [Spinachia spinachia]
MYEYLWSPVHSSGLVQPTLAPNSARPGGMVGGEEQQVQVSRALDLMLKGIMAMRREEQERNRQILDQCETGGGAGGIGGAAHGGSRWAATRPRPAVVLAWEADEAHTRVSTRRVGGSSVAEVGGRHPGVAVGREDDGFYAAAATTRRIGVYCGAVTESSEPSSEVGVTGRVDVSGDGGTESGEPNTEVGVTGRVDVSGDGGAERPTPRHRLRLLGVC